jgi:hypothetical protein
MCDHAGIYKYNRKRLNYHIENADFDSFLTKANGRFIKVSDDAFFIPKFIKYQYGSLNPSNSAHRGVLKVLDYYGLISEGSIKGLPRGFLAHKDKDKDIHIHKDKVNVIVNDLNTVLGTKYKTSMSTVTWI